MKKYRQLIVLMILFVIPGVSAYLIYNHPTWIKTSSVNKGQLLSPAINSHLTLGKKWQLVFWTPYNCDEICVDTLDKLARIRLALGRKLYLVNQWLLMSPQNFKKTLVTSLKNQDIHYSVLDNFDLFIKLSSNDNRIFIIDPHGFIILSYPAKVPPRDIFNDLERLLKTDEKMR